MPELTMSGLLSQSEKITKEYERLSGRWNAPLQIAHIHSEVSEVYQALKHGDERDHVLEEVADVFLSAFTLCNLLEIDSAELENAINKKLAVIVQRVGKLKEPDAE